MFKKNKNDEETIKAKVVKEKKANEKKLGKNDPKPSVTDIFKCQEIQFKDFRTYCTNYTKNGDWILNLGGESSIMETHDPEKEIDSKEFMETYDENLIQVYRHQDEALVSKNVKMIADIDPENKGLYSSSMVVSAHIVNKLSDSSPFSTKIIKKFCEEIADIYDRFMMKNEEDQVYGIHIWVPAWRTTSEKGFLVSLLDGRINFIIT